jgi:hypothetical protein
MAIKNGQEYTLRITSVLGHIMGLKYPDEYKNWQTTNIEDLFHGKFHHFNIKNSIFLKHNWKKFLWKLRFR